MRSARSAVVLVALLAGCNPQAPSTASSPAPASSASGASTASSAASPTPVPTPTPTAMPIHVVSQGSGPHFATFVEESHNRKVYVVHAVSSVADRRPDGSFNVNLTSPHITFYDRDGKSLRGSAPQAHILENGKTVTMDGGVHAVNGDGDVLTCDTMTYHQATEQIHGEGNVVLINPRGDRLTGQTIDADIRFDHVRVNGSP